MLFEFLIWCGCNGCVCKCVYTHEKQTCIHHHTLTYTYITVHHILAMFIKTTCMLNSTSEAAHGHAGNSISSAAALMSFPCESRSTACACERAMLQETKNTTRASNSVLNILGLLVTAAWLKLVLQPCMLSFR